MPKNDVLDLILSKDNEFQDGTEEGYFVSVSLGDGGTVDARLDFGNRIENYTISVEEVANE